MKKVQTRNRNPFDLDSDPRNPNPKPRRIRSPAFARVRLRPNAGCGKRNEGHTTPLLSWRVESADLSSGSAPESDKGSRKEKNVGWKRDGVVSARKLAAGIWHVNGGLGFEPAVLDLRSSSLHASTTTDRKLSSLTNYTKNDMLHKLEASDAVLDSSMERATKWDPGFKSHLKLLQNQPVTTISELEHARTRIAELETERQATKEKLDHIVSNLTDEKVAWRRREHEKIRTVIDSMKDDLHRERKNRKRMEMVNSKLVNELAEAKLSAKRFTQDYEKERKTRELMEEVCDELAREIGEDKAEVEAMKEECARIREEVEEERNMLQMAEVWREERVQMKLVDAKVTLEEKYSRLSKLRAEIEVFLNTRSDFNDEDKKEAELLRQAADSVLIQEIKDFSYQPPPASEDIFSIFEELHPKEEPGDREIKATINGVVDDNDDDSGWETVSHNASVSGTDWDENGKLNSETSEISSVITRESRKKGSSIARLWKSSYENCRRNSFEMMNGRMSNVTLSPSEELGLSSPDSVNQHVNGSMKKGCIEWPRGGVQKHCLKAKLLEARMETQKIQLRQALKQKI